MRLTRTFMLDRARARDAAWDGRFLTGVLSTGIYCLPSCPARPPKERNVRFFQDEEGARKAGLRPCLRCRPDDFLRGHDPDVALMRRVARELRREPGEFEDLAAVRRRFAVGATRLNALFRRHLHQRPLAYLNRMRVEAAARKLLESDESVLEIALAAGFDSPSAFHDNFRKFFFQCPGEYRRLRHASDFVFDVPRGWQLRRSLDLLARDPRSPTEARRGDTLMRALRIGRLGATLTIALHPGAARCEVEARRPLSTREKAAAHDTALRLLGLKQDPRPFERLASRNSIGRRITRDCKGLLSPQWPSAFEALTWSILGQQVNVGFAATLRRRLVGLCGGRVGDLRSHPSPGQVARLDRAELVRLQFSRRKAEYLIDLSRAVSAGKLELEGLRHEPASWVERRLLERRGIGPWSAHYVMMRGMSFNDCVPLGDVGLEEGLRLLLGLENRPDRERTLAELRPFVPFRSLATIHIWNRLGETP